MYVTLITQIMQPLTIDVLDSRIRPSLQTLLAIPPTQPNPTQPHPTHELG
jgi:hypothetical protein